MWTAAPWSDGAITYGTWQHVAVTVVDEGSTLAIRYYVDGSAVGTKTSTQTEIHNNAGALGIGIQAIGSLNSSEFRGQLDEVRVWNVARSQAEIQAGMDRRLSGNEPGLVASWHLDEGTDLATADATGNGHNGTLLGGMNDDDWVEPGAPLSGLDELTFIVHHLILEE